MRLFSFVLFFGLIMFLALAGCRSVQTWEEPLPEKKADGTVRTPMGEPADIVIKMGGN